MASDPFIEEPMAPLALRQAAVRRGLALAAALVLAVGLVLSFARTAAGQPPLPEVGADELLASVADAAADPPPMSGELTATLDLGLPELPAEAEALGSPALSALTGDRRLRLWRSPDGVRVAELGDASERSFTTDGEQVWLWASAEQRATHFEVPDLPDRSERSPGLGESPSGLPDAYLGGLSSVDPVTFAAAALGAIDEQTAVTVERTTQVAGRGTYRLVLTPRTDQTLVGRVELDIDAEQRVPLRAAVLARGATVPSVELAWSSVSFDPIDPATFEFIPPPGTQVVEGFEEGMGEHSGMPDGVQPPTGDMAPSPDVDGERAMGAEARTVGEGWTRVLALPWNGSWPTEGTADSAAPDAGAPEATGALGAALPFSGPLFSARVEQIGGQPHLLVGAVPQEGLAEAARSLQP